MVSENWEVERIGSQCVFALVRVVVSGSVVWRRRRHESSEDE